MAATRATVSRSSSSPVPSTCRPTVSRASSKRRGMTAARMSPIPNPSRSSRCGARSRWSCPYSGSTVTMASTRSTSSSRSPRVAPPSGRTIQPRPGSTAIGERIRPGATCSRRRYSATSNAVSGPAAFSHTVPPVVGARRTVAHGRRCGWVTSPVRSSRLAASCSSSHLAASRRQASDDQTAAPWPTWRQTCSPSTWSRVGRSPARVATRAEAGWSGWMWATISCTPWRPSQATSARAASEA